MITVIICVAVLTGFDLIIDLKVILFRLIECACQPDSPVGSVVF